MSFTIELSPILATLPVTEPTAEAQKDSGDDQAQRSVAVDELGFFLTTSDSIHSTANEDVDQERLHTIWWLNALKTLRTFSSAPGTGTQSFPCSVFSHPSTPLQRPLLRESRERIRSGLPFPSLRRVVWPMLLGSTFAPPDQYKKLVDIPVAFELTEVILRDLPRTFPTHCLFVNQNSYGQSALHRILVGYCALDPEVGYCQGMGFLVAVLLLHIPEEGAFWTFTQMMQGKRFEMRRLFLPDFPLLQHFFIVLRGLLWDFLPKLAEHFEQQAVDVSFFASQWFLTLFSYQLPLPMTCRLWDIFFSEGWKFIFQTTIAFLQWDEEKLITMKMEEILMHLKVIHEGKPVERVIQRAFDVPIEENDLKVEVGKLARSDCHPQY
jgi:hypothetical protein